MSDDIFFWLIRRKDTGEWFRMQRGRRWARQGNWVKERAKAKAYGVRGSARTVLRDVRERTAHGPAGTLSLRIDAELVRFRAVEEGVEE